MAGAADRRAAGLRPVGIVASVTVPLAEADVGVFVVSTYDTDLVLVKGADLDVAFPAGVAGHSLSPCVTPAL